MKFVDWLIEANKKWDLETNSSNLTAPPMTTEEFEDILVSELLGDDWYIGYSCSGSQARTEIIAEILLRYKKAPSIFERLLKWFKSKLEKKID